MTKQEFLDKVNSRLQGNMGDVFEVQGGEIIFHTEKLADIMIEEGLLPPVHHNGTIYDKGLVKSEYTEYGFECEEDRDE